MSKTLNKTITAKFFAADTGYAEMRRRWSEMVNNKESRKDLTASHHALYLALSGKSIAKAFVPITNNTKLTNGMQAHGGPQRALAGIWSYDYATRGYGLNPKVVGLFKDLLSAEVATLLRAILPSGATDADFDYTVNAIAFAEVS